MILTNDFHMYLVLIFVLLSISNWSIDQMSIVFINGLGDQASIPGQVTPKIQKMVVDATLLNTQLYKVRIKGKVEQSR